MRWHWLVGAMIAVSLVACGDSDQSDDKSGGSGGKSSSKGGRGGSGGKSSSNGGRGGAFDTSSGDGGDGESGATSSGDGGDGESGGTSSSDSGDSDSGGTGDTSTTDGSGGRAGDSVGGSGGDSANGGSSGGAGSSGTSGAPEPSTFTCNQLGALASDASDRKCYDFSNSSDAAAFTPQGGTWTMANGAYLGKGPLEAVTCAAEGLMFTASTLSSISAADVRVHLKMTSLSRPDKVLVLRESDSGNRIEINFRASFLIDGQIRGNDMVVQELVNCQYTEHLGTYQVSIPHTEGQTIAVDVELRGQQLKVTVDGNLAYNQTLPVATTAGSVGFAVILGSDELESLEMFDDFVVETLK